MNGYKLEDDLKEKLKGKIESLGQLMNCLLTIKIDSENVKTKEKTAFLRPVFIFTPVALNLEKEETEYLLSDKATVLHLPPRKKIYFDLGNTQFPMAVQVDSSVDLKKLETGKIYKITFPRDAPRVELALRVYKSKKGFILKVTSKYRAGTKKSNFTTVALEKAKINFPRQLAKARGELAGSVNRLAGLRLKYSQARAIRVTSRTIAIRKANLLTKIAKDVRSTQGKIAKRQNEINYFRGAINTLPSLENAIQILHNQVQIMVRIYAVTDSAEIDLVRSNQ